jgi:ferric-dicitrate binding protein FerR (iron transport regulator)
MNDQPSQEMSDLCSAAADGQLTPTQTERLNELVRDDPQARRFYVDYLEVHALLQWRHGGVEPLEIPLASARPQVATRLRSRHWLTAAAAVVCVAVAVVVLLTTMGQAPWQPRKNQSIAIVLDQEDVRWNTEALIDGEQQLRPGRQRIESGVAHIELANGVLLAAGGPCDFEITAADHVHLYRGKLHIYSPLATRGFTVTTPRGVQIVDLGTRFGVWADDNDAVHVHLYDGRLLINGKTQLAAGEAITIDAVGQLHDETSDTTLFPPLHRE